MSDRQPDRAGGLTFAVFGKSLVIALCAALIPWMLFAQWWADTQVDGFAPSLAYGIVFLPGALLGSFAVGLPIALLTFALAGEVMAERPIAVFIAANLAAVMMALVLAVLGGPISALIYGWPCWIAANLYAVLGWFWILRPMREANN